MAINSHQNTESHWFGYTPVEPEQKTAMVKGVFDSVAAHYDLMNDLMSMGIHRLWKRSLIRQIKPQAGQSLLDVAGGTGDIAFGFMDYIRGKGAPVTVLDINAEMLREGQKRAAGKGYQDKISWVLGDAEQLPFPDNSFDVYTIAFGLRNVTQIDAALAEAKRVLRPGGRFFCLEFSQVVIPLFDKIYDLYSFVVLPRIGKLVAKNSDAYQYLVESIRKFPNQQALAERIKNTGMQSVKWRNMTGGIVAVHSGQKSDG